jgi:hypothetical protein
MSRNKSGFAEWWAREGERWYERDRHCVYLTESVAEQVYDSIVASLGSVQTNLIGNDATP